MASTLRPVCDCSSYAFPHRAGGGRCDCSWSTVRQWDYVNKKFLPDRIKLDELCEGCGQPAETREMDFGIGAYEFWGACGVDTNIQTVSECCEAGMVPNSRAEHLKHKWEIVK